MKKTRYLRGNKSTFIYAIIIVTSFATSFVISVVTSANTPLIILEDPSDNSLYILPPKYTPRTDLMSKLILNNDDVINIVVSVIIGKCTLFNYILLN